MTFLYVTVLNRFHNLVFPSVALQHPCPAIQHPPSPEGRSLVLRDAASVLQHALPMLCDAVRGRYQLCTDSE
jgi:hypothetical protein